MKFSSYDKIVVRVPLNSFDKAKQDIDYDNKLFNLGIYLSSPNLWNEYNSSVGLKQANPKVINSLSKYWIRSCSRCTPYGTFAGSFIAQLHDSGDIVIEGYSTNTRLDTNLLHILIDKLSSTPLLRDQLLFDANNSLYLAADTYRYVEYKMINGYRNYQLTGVKKTKYLDQVLSIVSHKSVSIIDLVSSISSMFELSQQQAHAYVINLIDAQILTCTLEPSLTGGDPLQQCISILEGVTQSKNVVEVLMELRSTFEKGVPLTLVDYECLRTKIQNLFLVDDLTNTPFQTDLFFKTKKATIDQKIIEAILDQICKLKAFNRSYRSNDLSNFKEKFKSIYGEDTEVGLSIALDSDLGIGYGVLGNSTSGSHEFINDLYIQQKSVDGGDSTEHFDAISKFIINKFIECIGLGSKEIEISDEDLKLLERLEAKINLPIGQYVIGSLMSDNQVLNSENFKFSLKGLGGSSAGNIISRFATGNDEINDLLKEIITYEESSSSDVIFAEIVHLPQARVGNVILRPVLRGYEIPYISRSSLVDKNKIPLDDLFISVQKDVVVIRSKTLKKRIIPCLTNAHNFSSNAALPVYKFLCDLQLQNKSTFVWDWGILKDQKFLPRVKFKNIIVKPATWSLNINELGINETIESLVSRWIKTTGLPDLIKIKEQDSDLFIDINSPRHFEILVNHFKKNKSIVVEESLQRYDNLIIENELGEKFTNELIIPLKHTEFSTKPFPSVNWDNTARIESIFPPGSQWLYFKIYSGNTQLEKILVDLLLPFVEGNRDLFNLMFFVRYYDDIGPHIRVRFLNIDTDKMLMLQRLFLDQVQHLVQNKLIKSVQIDTYVRELNRYGGESIVQTEELFHNDSIAVLALLDIIQGNDEFFRIILAMRCIDAFLDDFNFSMSQKNDLLQTMRYSFFEEFGGHPNLKKQLNGKFREKKALIFQFMDLGQDVENELLDVSQILEIRSKSNERPANQMKAMLSTEKLNSILPSLIHMTMNRMFVSKQRSCELVIYHFLERFYSSKFHKSPLKQLEF